MLKGKKQLWLGILAALLLWLSGGAFQPARAQTECGGPTYTIQPGDTLFSVAELCGVPYAALVGINVEISNPDLIRPGQVIRLVAGAPLYNTPASGPAQPGGLSEDGRQYIVRRGDSLARIVFLYGIRLPDLLAANPGLNPAEVIHPDQVLQMPGEPRRAKGWIGVSTRSARARQAIEVRLVDFLPYARVDLNLGEIYDGELYIYDTQTVQVDSRGSARVTYRLPYYAWYGEEWVIEAVTTATSTPARHLSPVITIE